MEDTWRRKIEELRSVFAVADAGLQERVCVTDWLSSLPRFDVGADVR